MVIVIYGATGFTGRLVAGALARAGHELIVAGRDPDRSRALAATLGVSWRSASADDPAALARAVEGADTVVSCAGPFSELGEPVLQAALAAGASFADISGEQAYARDIYERYESRARRARRAVVTGLGFEPAAGDLAAALAADALGPGRLDEVSIAYALSRIPYTHGVVASIRAALASPWSTWAYDRWEPARPGAEQSLISFPEPFGVRLAISAPLAAAITVPRHLDTAEVHTLLAAGRSSRARKLALRLASAAAPALPALARSPLAAEVSHLAPTQPTDDDLAGARVAVVAEARRGFDRARVALSGSDPYRLTAELVALAVPALRGAHGALAPAEALDPKAALEHLRERAGVEVEGDP